MTINCVIKTSMATSYSPINYLQKSASRSKLAVDSDYYANNSKKSEMPGLQIYLFLAALQAATQCQRCHA